MEFPYLDEKLGGIISQIVEYGTFVPVSATDYSSFVPVFYVFVGIEIATTLVVVLLVLLRVHRTHFAYDWLLSLLHLFFKWVFQPFYVPLFGTAQLITTRYSPVHIDVQVQAGRIWNSPRAV